MMHFDIDDIKLTLLREDFGDVFRNETFTFVFHSMNKTKMKQSRLSDKVKGGERTCAKPKL